jgi:hypothetical protein
VPHEPQRAERRRAAITPLNADSVGQRVSICHNLHRPTQAFGDFGHSCEQRSDRFYPWHSATRPWSYGLRARMSPARRWNETALALPQEELRSGRCGTGTEKKGGELTRYFGQMKNPSGKQLDVAPSARGAAPLRSAAQFRVLDGTEATKVVAAPAPNCSLRLRSASGVLRADHDCPHDSMEPSGAFGEVGLPP